MEKLGKIVGWSRHHHRMRWSDQTPCQNNINVLAFPRRSLESSEWGAPCRGAREGRPWCERRGVQRRVPGEWRVSDGGEACEGGGQWPGVGQRGGCGEWSVAEVEVEEGVPDLDVAGAGGSIPPVGWANSALPPPIELYGTQGRESGSCDTDCVSASCGAGSLPPHPPPPHPPPGVEEVPCPSHLPGHMPPPFGEGGVCARHRERVDPRTRALTAFAAAPGAR